MRRCVLNDCNINEPDPALCCLDCFDREQCPDKCPRTSTTYCTGLIEVYNDKDTSRTIQKESVIR